MSFLSYFFLRHVVYFYCFYLKYAIVPFCSLTLCVMALQQADCFWDSILEEPQGGLFYLVFRRVHVSQRSSIVADHLVKSLSLRLVGLLPPWNKLHLIW